MNHRLKILSIFVALISLAARAEEKGKITHSFLATGAETRIVGAGGQTLWSYPRGTRDGWVLPNGNLLLALSKDKDFPGGGVVEVTREGKTVFEFKGSQSEVNTAHALSNGNTVIAAYAIGAKRTKLLEVTPGKKVVWTHTDDHPHGIHEVQILDTNGKPINAPPLR